MSYKEIGPGVGDRPLFSRRRLVSALAVALGTSWAIGCSRESRVEESIEQNGDKKFLLKVIESLPETAIKRLLSERVSPYFNELAPPTVERGGVVFNNHGSTFVLRKSTGAGAVSGFESIRGKRLPRKKELVYPLEKSSRKFPVPAIVTEEEKLVIGLKKTDTPIVVLEFDPNNPIVAGLAPEIIIETLNVQEGRPVLSGDVFENYVILKELCGVLLSDLYLEELAKKHRELGLPINIKVIDKMHKIIEAEIISQGFESIHARNGRLKAALDIAAYILAFSAIKDTPAAKTFLATSMLPVVLGDNPTSILYGSLEWAIKESDAHKLFHRGDINKWP